MVSPQAFSGQPRARRFSTTAWVAVQNAVEGTTQVLLFLQLLFLLLPLFLLPFGEQPTKQQIIVNFNLVGVLDPPCGPPTLKSEQSNQSIKAMQKQKHTHKQHAQNVCHSLSPKTFRAASSSWSGFLSHGVARPDGNMSTEKECFGNSSLIARKCMGHMTTIWLPPYFLVLLCHGRRFLHVLRIKQNGLSSSPQSERAASA